MNTKYIRASILIVSGLVLAVLLVGGYFNHRPKPAVRHARIAMTVGTPLVAPVLYADSEHLWAKVGLEVKLDRLLLGRACLDAVLSGDADVATVAETPILHSAGHGIELEVLCVFCSSDQHVHVAARRDRGVQSPGDLEGRVIATALGTNNEYYLRQFLKHNGLDGGRTKLLNYDPAQMTNGLIGNVIDAAAFWNPYLDDCKAALGEKLIIFPPGDYYTVYYCLVARKGFAATNPEVAHQLVLGLDQASRQMRADSQKAIPSIATALPMRQDLLRSIWSAYRFEVQFPEAFKAEMFQEASWIGEKDPRAGERAKEFIFKLKPSVSLRADANDPINDSAYR